MAVEENQVDAYFRVFTQAANYCYDIGQADIVFDILQDVIQDSTRMSSSDSIRIVATYIGREATSGGAATWSKW
jgi:hypothetical protein